MAVDILAVCHHVESTAVRRLPVQQTTHYRFRSRLGQSQVVSPSARVCRVSFQQQVVGGRPKVFVDGPKTIVDASASVHVALPRANARFGRAVRKVEHSQFDR